MYQKEITRPLSILGDDGLPQNFGWSRQPVLYYEPTMITSPVYRITGSDRYIVHSPTHLIVFEIRDNAWLGYMCISVISLRDRKRSTQSYTTFLPMGSYEMPSTSSAANGKSAVSRWRRKKTHIDFINMEAGVKIIKVEVPNFGRHRSLRGELVLMEPEYTRPELRAQSLVTSQPWKNEKRAFQITRCSPWYTVEGVIQFGSSEIIFTRGNGWGIFDWYRAVRPKADICYWASACGMNDGKLLSFCVGYCWADFSYGTENAFFVDGIIHKLDQITFHIPLSNWLSPWRFTSNDNRLEMAFSPHQERTDRRRLFFHNSTRRQVCGYFSGKVLLDDETQIEFNGLTGFAERSKTRL